MGFCNYCYRDINKKALIRCKECNMFYCKKCFSFEKKLCINCYVKNIETQQEEMLNEMEIPDITY